MARSRRPWPGVMLALVMVTPASGQEWPHPGGDAGQTKHSSLNQIPWDNVFRLEVAWAFDTGDWSDGTELPSRSA